MATSKVRDERVHELNETGVREGGDYVLYWMQQSQRAEHNDALEYAVGRANELDLPLLVVFGLTDDYPEANARHYAFMLEGLKDAGETLKERGIKFVVGRGSPDEIALRYGEHAALIVTDGAYLRPEKAWKERVSEGASCLVIGVESNVVVPVQLASNKREHAARTLRPKIHKHLDHFLVELKPTKVEQDSLSLDVEDGLDLSDISAVLDGMDLDEGAWPLREMYTGGATAGREALGRFLKENFAEYVEHRNQPQTSDVSHMSKYLHYGHLSPVYIVLEVMNSGGPQDDIDSYVEEVVVRRELSINFCFYTPDYDSYSCLPDWAKKTLKEHESDEREYVYTREQLESAETHDAYWNAAMREMIYTGYMHNHMRMYWGKKILEWSRTPEQAYETTLYLNDKYFVDGRDANSYANIAWVFGNHDRGWKERDVLGKIRYMSAGGLERKAKPKEYVEKVDRLVEEGRPEAL